MTTGGTVVASIGAGAADDAAGNPSEASTSTDNSVTWTEPDPGDTTAPEVTIDQGATQADPTSVSPVVFDVEFSEPVTGFAAGDVDLGGTAGGTLVAGVTGSGTTYTVSVTGMTTGGTVVASIGAGAADDAAGNPSEASTSTDNSVTWTEPDPGDTTAPEVTIDQGATQADPTSVSPVVFDVEFSEPVTGFAAGDVDLGGTAGGTLVAGVTGSGTTYTVSVTGMTTGGTVVASIGAGAADDAAGNPSEASTSTDNSVTWTEPDPGDTTAPEVTIDQGATQADPTSVSPVVFDVEFSEPVTGFAAGDVDLGGTAGGTLVAGVTGSGTTYTVSVTGMTTGGTVVASIGAGAADDAAGNPSEASTSTDNSVTWTEPDPGDTTAPEVTIDQGATQADPTSVSPVVFDVEFSEPVTGFAAGDVDLGGTAGGTLVAGVTGSGTTYTVSVTGMTTGGTVVASIGAGAADDAAGNPSEASTSTDNSVTWTEPDPGDTTAPEVTIDQGATQADPTLGEPGRVRRRVQRARHRVRRRRRRSRRDRGRHPRRRRHGLGHDVHGLGHRDDDRRHGRREHRRRCRGRCRGQPERGVDLDRQQRHLDRARPGRHDRPADAHALAVALDPAN